MQDSAKRQIDSLITAMKGQHDAARAPDDLRDAVAQARDHAADLAGEDAIDWPHQAHALHAVIFGLNETERQIVRLSGVLSHES